MMTSFAEWLRKARAEARLSQDRLSDAALVLDKDCGIHQTRISSWERGATVPYLLQFNVLVEAMKCDPTVAAVGKVLWEQAELAKTRRSLRAEAAR